MKIGKNTRYSVLVGIALVLLLFSASGMLVQEGDLLCSQDFESRRPDG